MKRWCLAACLVAACSGKAEPEEAPRPRGLDAEPFAIPGTPQVSGVRPDLGPRRPRAPVDAAPAAAVDVDASTAVPAVVDEPKGGSGPHEVKVKFEGASGEFRGLTREEVDRVVKSR